MTDGKAKKAIADALDRFEISFVDCGMGIYKTDDMLAGQLRVTSSTPGAGAEARQHIAFTDGEQDEYSQIIELNALNAALAVMKWKKITGFYLDLEHNTVYVIDGNTIINDIGTRDAHGDQP